jgi:hypothetical protein
MIPETMSDFQTREYLHKVLAESLEGKTFREIFDIAKAHLLTQKARSISEEDACCQYRGPNGLKCAVGCFIPDDKYTPLIEGKPVDPLFARYTKKPYWTLLADIQGIHDGWEPEDWEQQLHLMEGNLEEYEAMAPLGRP